MTNRISGPGLGLPLPSFLYPSQLFNTPPDIGSNRVVLSPGAALPLPAGDLLVSVGNFGLLQFLDPLTNGWSSFDTQHGQPQEVYSPGDSTRRIANLLGCPISAIIVDGGTGFTQATAAITASVGGSTWNAIVGGSLAVKSITAPGAGFTVQPLVLLPDPPSYSANNVGGIPALAYAALTNGTVSGVTLNQVGAGYQQATITGLIVPSPFDPAVGSITPGTVTFTLTNSGVITGAVCTDNGAPLATLTALTLTAAGGGGSGASLTPIVLQTIAAATIAAGGAAWGTATAPARIFSNGGVPVSVSAIGNTTVELTGFKPRDAYIVGTTNAGGTITGTTIVESGLFTAVPTAAFASGGTIPTTAASVTFSMGTAEAVVTVQPL